MDIVIALRVSNGRLAIRFASSHVSHLRSVATAKLRVNVSRCRPTVKLSGRPMPPDRRITTPRHGPPPMLLKVTLPPASLRSNDQIRDEPDCSFVRASHTCAVI